MDTLTQLQDVFRRIFDDESLTITRATTAQDVEAWDSVQNVTLMLEVESEFKVRFSTSEMAYLKNVGDLVDLIEKKQQKKK
jgi:acyl carrier protein